MFRSVILGVVAAAVASAALVAQVRDTRAAAPPVQQPGAKGVIAGVVVAVDSGRPVRRARVMLIGGTPRVAQSVQSDDQGGFRFANLPAGQFTLSSSKGGYIETVYGQKQPGSGRPGTPIQLLAGQELKQVSMPLARGGVITGLVVEETGEPAFNAQVQAYRWVTKQGERTLQLASSGSTDDRGMYRLPGLLPGSYVVSASGRGQELEIGMEGMAYFKVLEAMDRLGEPAIAIKADKLFVDAHWAEDAPAVPKTGFGTMYDPGTTLANSAATIPLGISEERGGIDFQLQVVPFGKVSGIIAGAEGPVRGASVQLIDLGQIPGLGVRNAKTAADGRFTFNGVPPGQYSVLARATPKGAQLEAGGREAVQFLASQELAQNLKRREELAVAIARAAQLWGTADVGFDGRDVNDVHITLQPGLTVSGRVELEGGTGPAPSLTRMSVTLTPVGQTRTTGDVGQPMPGPVDANGMFTVRGLLPGRYTVSIAAGAPAGYTMKSAVFGGIDVLDHPFDLNGTQQPSGGLVTLSTKTTDVTGMVQDASGQPMPGVTVIAFPLDERFWTPNSRRIQGVRPATDGRYGFKNLPAGEYRVIAVLDAEPGQWFDPAFLRSLGGFVTLSVMEGGRHTLDLRAK